MHIDTLSEATQPADVLTGHDDYATAALVGQAMDSFSRGQFDV